MSYIFPGDVCEADEGMAVLNAGQSRIAREIGRVEGVDFIERVDWPFLSRDLRWTGDQFGWRRKDDPRFFACCGRCQ